MKIFKHRGDIYISKSGYKSSREERILVTLLIVIIVLTVAFVAVLCHKYSSIAEFIAGDDVTVGENVVVDENQLPVISGKTNFLVFETDDEQSVIHYAFLIQIDSDNLSYKVCTLSPDMEIQGKSLYDLYLTGGGALIRTELTSYLGFDIDYFAGFDNSSFIEFINKMGTFIYPSSQEVKFNGGEDEDTYSVRIKEGEKKLEGNDLANLIRYYSTDGESYQTANEIILYGLTQLFNEDNYDKSETLFRSFISASSTNITVRDFENEKDSLQVFSTKNNDVTIYSCPVQYENNQLTDTAMQNIKGYFAK